jgi:hypothetical protein
MDEKSTALIEKFRQLCPTNQEKVLSQLDRALSVEASAAQYEFAARSASESNPPVYRGQPPIF